MHWAAIRKHNEIVRFLIDEGAPLNAVDDQGETAEAWAIRKGATKCAATLRAAQDYPAQFGRKAVRETEGPMWFVYGFVSIVM